MAANNAATLQAAYDNYCRIWLMCTEILANPQQSNIDSLVTTAANTAVVQPKITYSEDGATYNWTEYQMQLGDIMEKLRTQMILSAGPFSVNSRGTY